MGHILGYLLVSLIWFALGSTIGRDVCDWWRMRRGGFVHAKRLDHVPPSVEFLRCLPDPSPRPRRRAS